jgi:inner membrane protein
MFLLGHLGITATVVFAINKRYFPSLSLDYRVIFVLAMLPDLIDKTMGHIILRDELNSGRLVAHTLLFSMLGTLVLYRFSNKNWQLLSLPLWLHISLDRIWENVHVMLWPLQGWGFPSRDYNVLAHWWEIFTTDPYTIAGELVGGLLILMLMWKLELYKWKNMKRFLETGRIEKEREPAKAP